MQRKSKLVLVFIVILAIIVLFNFQNVLSLMTSIFTNTGLLIAFIFLAVVLVLLYYLSKPGEAFILKKMFSWVHGKGDVKVLDPTKRIRLCRYSTLKFIHNLCHEDISDERLEELSHDNKGNFLSRVGTEPSARRKDADSWDLYIWKWGRKSVGFRDIPGKTENHPHILYYIIQNCSNGECFPLATIEYDSAGKILNKVWLGGWQKFEESEFMKSIQQQFVSGYAQEKGKEAAEKSESSKEKEESK